MGWVLLQVRDLPPSTVSYHTDTHLAWVSFNRVRVPRLSRLSSHCSSAAGKLGEGVCNVSSLSTVVLVVFIHLVAILTVLASDLTAMALEQLRVQLAGQTLQGASVRDCVDVCMCIVSCLHGWHSPVSGPQ